MTAVPVLPAPLPALAPFVAAGVLLESDLRLAERLGRLGGEDDPAVLLAAALALRGPRHGHVCVELDTVAERVAVDPRPAAAAGGEDGGGGGEGGGPVDAAAEAPAELPWPDPDPWVAALSDSPLVRREGPDAPADGDGAAAATPLVLDGRRLYLDRYWRYEQQLADALVRRAAEGVGDVEPAALAPWLDELFPATDELDRQRLAAALAVLRRLTVIAGGPGTGKTFTVTRVLALLHRQAMAAAPDRPLRVALAAPTGKAAARLQESLREGLAQLALPDEVRDALARTPASTIHRLLGTRRDAPTRFRHDAGDPLPHDVVIVDEASMVSLPLMAKLVDAVRPDARLILLGDRDQLASVEAGAAFGDICGPAGSRPVLQLSEEAIVEASAALGRDVGAAPELIREPAAGIWDAVVRLDRFRRFDRESGLGAVATALQQAGDDSSAALQRIAEGAFDADGEGVRLLDPDRDGDAARAACESDVVAAYTAYAHLAVATSADGDVDPVFEALAELRVLCALRRGRDGVVAWNTAIERRLVAAVPDLRIDQPWYVGRPILVRENDYAVRLYNGDVGVILADPADPGRRVAVFRATDGTVRRLSPARLPACETTFAMTIHKSQGSQFAHAVVVLPGVPSPILTRELIYTGITRATARTTILGRRALLAEALDRPVQRATGLQSRLWR